MKTRKKELLDAQINGITDTEYENYKNRYLEILKEGNLEYKSDLKTNSYQQDERRLLTPIRKVCRQSFAIYEEILCSIFQQQSRSRFKVYKSQGKRLENLEV